MLQPQTLPSFQLPKTHMHITVTACTAMGSMFKACCACCIWHLKQYKACLMLWCHLVFCLGSVQVCISSLQPPDPEVCQPRNEHGNEGKGESVGCAGCPMAVGPTALAVEGQQTHHQHPQVGQLTPPLHITVQFLCREMQSLAQTVLSSADLAVEGKQTHHQQS